MKAKTIAEEIAAVLNVALDGRASVTGGDGHVLVALSNLDYQQNLGHLFQQVALIIEEAFPVRSEEISLLFKNENGSLQQQFHIRPAEQQHFN